MQKSILYEDNMTPEDRVEKITKQLSISRQELSEALGISLSSVAMYFNGYHKIRKVVAMAIQTAFGINAKWILHNKQPIFVKNANSRLSDDAMEVAITYSTLPKKSQEIIKTIIYSLKNLK